MRLNFNNVCFIYILANVEVAKVRRRDRALKKGVNALAKEYLGSDIAEQGKPLSLNFQETVISALIVLFDSVEEKK